MTESNQEVIIRFNTTLPDEYKVSEDDLVLPASLQRYGLSEIINKLLERETPIPFDFLIKNKFLRTSLQDWLLAEKKTAEETIEIEYVLAVPPLETSPQNSGQDWISHVLSVGGRRAVSSSYDGVLRRHEWQKPVTELAISSQSLTALGGDEDRLIVGSVDGKVYFVDPHEMKVLASSHVDTEGINTASLSHDSATAATGGWNNIVNLWNADDVWLNQEENEQNTKKRAREKEIKPQGSFAGHKGAVQCVKFGPGHKLYSTALDNTLKIWDLTQGEQSATTFETGKPGISFSTRDDGSQLALSHEDGRITIWDIRTQPGMVVEHKSTFRPHRRMCPQVVWAQDNINRLASVSHDGTFKILDLRSPDMPIQTVQLKNKESETIPKGLCIDFMNKDGNEIIVGASDGNVYMHVQK